MNQKKGEHQVIHARRMRDNADSAPSNVFTQDLTQTIEKYIVTVIKLNFGSVSATSWLQLLLVVPL